LPWSTWAMMAMLRSDIEVDLALQDGRERRGLVRERRGKSQPAGNHAARNVVRRNITLQDFTRPNSLLRKGTGLYGGITFTVKSIFRLAPLCTASYITAREAFVTPLPFLGVSSL